MIKKIKKIKKLFTLENYFVKLFASLFLISFVVNIFMFDTLVDLFEEKRKYTYDKKIVQEELLALSESKRKRFIWPIRKGKLTSKFGSRFHPISRRNEFHCGIDIGCPKGTLVRASEAGRVLYNGWRKGYGRIIVIRHTDGYVTVYAHNKYNYRRARVGKWVEKGKVIAVSGDTGYVTGPHLHFEIRKSLNPLWFFENNIK
jgi:murein DD-endopeptidase MepM/ murein hydrolase activator NlpD